MMNYLGAAGAAIRALAPSISYEGDGRFRVRYRTFRPVGVSIGGVTVGDRGNYQIGVSRRGRLRMGYVARKRQRRHGRRSFRNNRWMPKHTSRKRKATRRRSKKGYKRTKNCCKQVKALNKRVNKITRSLAVNLSHKTFRTRKLDFKQGVVGQSILDLLDYSMTEIRAGKTVRIYDPVSGPTSVDLFGSDYGQKVRFTKVADSWKLTNGCIFPVTAECWICVPKKRHSTFPDAAWQNGLIDQGAPYVGSSNVVIDNLSYPTDSNLFNELWKIARHEKRTIMPGKHVTCRMYSKPFNMESAGAAETFESFDPEFPNWVYMVRYTGAIVHDSTTNPPTGTALSDFLIDREYNLTEVVEYESGGFDYNDLAISDTKGTAATTDERPTPDISMTQFAE